MCRRTGPHRGRPHLRPLPDGDDGPRRPASPGHAHRYQRHAAQRGGEGNSPGTGESLVYTVFYVETNPVYAEQPVEISSPQLESRCGAGWRWEPGSGGTPIDQTSGTGTATAILDDDGNATFVFKGASCAAGPSAVIADVMAGSHPTYVTTYTVVAPKPAFAAGRMGISGGNQQARRPRRGAPSPAPPPGHPAADPSPGHDG